MVVIYSDDGKRHIRNKLWKLRLKELKKVKLVVGYDKGERLKMSRKIFKN